MLILSCVIDDSFRFSDLRANTGKLVVKCCDGDNRNCRSTLQN